MKKILILTILVLTTLNVFTQQNDSLRIKVANSLISIAEPLKTSPEHVYQVLVDKQRIDAYADLRLPIVSFILLVGFIFNISKSKWKEKDYSNQNPEEERFNRYAAFSIITGFFFLICSITFIVDFPKTLQGLMNPEQGAIEYILNLSK